ncbi:MAG: T9SS type A sorting domain-containing protein [Chlorobiota bacterium]|nr:T9SS type A sorting domain-containing protein [Chlorobiota bacterium]QQS67839.1 MAG: T9SS type A sorting domain-containing protein [Chlorobiota bacterium]
MELIPISSLNDQNHNKLKSYIYPNPSKRVVCLKLDSGYESGNVSLFDINFKRIKTIEFVNQNNLLLDVSGFIEGCYTIIIVTKNGSTLKK